MSFDPTIALYIVIGISVICIGWIIRLEVRIHKLLGGKQARSFETLVVDLQKDIRDLRNFEKDSIEYFGIIEKRIGRSIQSVETLRFNPFKGTGEGGNQSFSTSFINEKGDGVVISSLYSRDRVSVFSKPLKKFESTFELTEEERHVVEKAKSEVSQVK